MHSQPELLETIIHPGALDSMSQLAEDINDMHEQLKKQMNRIKELKIKKADDPGL